MEWARRPRRTQRLRCFSGLVLLLALLFVWAPIGGFVANARGDLRPEEVAIVAVRSSKDSIAVAEHYARARDIPPAHICYIDVKPGKDLGRRAWQERVRPAIRRWLLDQRLEGQVRCLVTVWDVPLRISKRTADLERRRAFFQAERRLRLTSVAENLRAIETILADEKSVDPPEIPDDATSETLKNLVQGELKAAKRRMALADPGDVPRASRQLAEGIAGLGGMTAGLEILAGQLESMSDGDAELGKRVAFAKGRVVGLRDAKDAVERLPESVERDEQILTIVASAEGDVGAIHWIDGQLERLKKNESYSSFDSELSLLFWLDYPLDRWLPNLLHYQFDGSPERARKPTLMVSRLEAPTVAITKRLVDDAIATEKDVLEGKIYLDARGLSAPSDAKSRGSYGEYDQAIRELAELLGEHTQETVVLDNEKELFQPGDCPDTGLYCGWYSLAKYIDAFQFRRGAVAYHIASSEATTLRNPDSQVWCKRLLEEGVCATLGPVHEPYLAAFPRPDDFFVALLSGRFSLAECYYRTKPFNSWVMVLVGDPLYNPFRNRPALAAEKLPERPRKVLGSVEP